MEKVQVNHFPIISLWELSVVMATNQEADRQMFGYFELLLPKQHFVVLEEFSLKNSLF